MPRSFTLFLLGLPLTMASCGYDASKAAHQAQINMIGMSEADLESCAGPPDKTIVLNSRAHILNYLYKPGGTGGLTVTLPLTLGAIALGGSGTYCSTNFRVVDHKVTELHYAGDNDKTIGDDGVCLPIVRGCLRQPEPTMLLLGSQGQPGASGFHSPNVQRQTTQAETINDAASTGK